MKRGIQRVKGKDTKPKKSVTLQIACDLNTNASVDNLEQLRNCTIYVQLGQGTSRSQTAVVSRTAMMQEDGWMKNKVLMAGVGRGDRLAKLWRALWPEAGGEAGPWWSLTW